MIASQVVWPGKEHAPTILHSQQICIDFVEYLWSYIRVLSHDKQVVSRLKAQYESDMRSLRSIFQEQAQVRVAHLRYCELEEQARQRIERIRRLAVVLWPHEAANIEKTVVGRASEMGIALPEGWETPSMWEAALEIVRQFPNIQMVDLLAQLNQLGIDASRQAVDSALKAHPELFAVKRVGKGKYVSLAEGSRDAASTKAGRK